MSATQFMVIDSEDVSDSYWRYLLIPRLFHKEFFDIINFLEAAWSAIPTSSGQILTTRPGTREVVDIKFYSIDKMLTNRIFGGA